MYRDLPMSERLDRIGELLAKGVYLHIKKEREEAKEEKEIVKLNNELISTKVAKVDKNQ